MQIFNEFQKYYIKKWLPFIIIIVGIFLINTFGAIMWFIIAIAFFIAAIIVILKRFKNASYDSSQSNNAAENNEVVIQKIHSDFQRIGWGMWDESIHHAEGQLKRLERAVIDKSMSIVSFEEDNTAIIKGSSGKTYVVSKDSCTCPDFNTRKLPCKHMYLLAIYLNERSK